MGREVKPICWGVRGGKLVKVLVEHIPEWRGTVLSGDKVFDVEEITTGETFVVVGRRHEDLVPLYNEMEVIAWAAK